MIIKIMTLIIVALLSSVNCQAQERNLDYYLKQVPFIMPKVVIPEFPDKVFNVTEYGLKGFLFFW